MTRSKSLGLLALYFVAIATATSAVLALFPWLPDLASEEGQRIDMLWWVFVGMSVIILSIVMAIVVYSLLHFRVKGGDMSDGEPVHGHHTLELVWTVIPTLVVIAIGWFSYAVLTDNERGLHAGASGEPRSGAAVMDVRVHAFQFGWSFDYPEAGVKGATELVLPKGRLVRFHIDSKIGDVIHSFWVPEARIKQDAVPGIVTKTQWTPSKLGHWQVVCAELCGSNHNAMRAEVRVVTPDTFRGWLQDQRSGSDDESGDRA